jgi:L-lactate dehydrogenase complex protein LldG
MSAREAILAAIKANRPSGHHDLPVVPALPFRGPIPTGSLAAAAVVCSAVHEICGGYDLSSVTRPQDLAAVDIAVVRACFGIAETGSVLFTEGELHVNALAYLAQHLVVLLDPEDIVPSTQDAYRRADFNVARYASFHTGPSATADIEGVLIHGAQGVRSLTVLMQPRAASNEKGGLDATAVS